MLKSVKMIINVPAKKIINSFIIYLCTLYWSVITTLYSNLQDCSALNVIIQQMYVLSVKNIEKVVSKMTMYRRTCYLLYMYNSASNFFQCIYISTEDILNLHSDYSYVLIIREKQKIGN